MYTESLQLLRKMVGNDAEFHDGQWEAIENALQGKKTLVVQRTGWGKSVVYFIASKLLNQRTGGVTLLISPLLSLIRNQMEAAQKMGLRVATINSSNTNDWPLIEQQLRLGQCDLLLISPERLSNPDFTEFLLPNIKNGINMLVVDESHCISDWGHDFRPDYRKIVDILNRITKSIPVLATTATANNRVIEDIKQQIEGNLEILRGPLMRESLKIQTINLPEQSQRMAWLKENLPKIPGSGIIYCLTTSDCENIATWLQENGINAVPYHSRLASDSEENNLLREAREQLLINNQVKVLVSTVALGMGFDKPDITFVIHFQTPGNIIKYYQEIGRAGRKVDTAYAILLTGEEDQQINQYFIENSFPSQGQLKDVLQTIEDSDIGLSIPEIERQINISSSKLRKCILFLELYGLIYKSGYKYSRTPNAYDYATFGFEEVKNIRYEELHFMDQYIKSKECYMKQIASELDDPLATICGRCENCNPDDILNKNITDTNILAAQHFLKNTYMIITPRKQIPAGIIGDRLQTLYGAAQNEEGRILCNYGTAGWGNMVAKNKYQDKHFCAELIDASANLIENIWGIKGDIDYIIAIPSIRRPNLVPDFAKSLAKKLNIPYLETLIKIQDTPEQKTMENSWQQAKNVQTAFQVNHSFSDHNILLVDDIVDSKWTLTLCGKLLKDQGAGRIYPFAIASTAKG